MPQFTFTQDKTLVEFRLKGNIYIGDSKGGRKGGIKDQWKKQPGQ